MYNKATVRELVPNLKGARVLWRFDGNVPMKKGEDGKNVITDDTRLKEAMADLLFLLEHGASVTGCTHLGRPKGKGFEEDFSVEPIYEWFAQNLSKHLPNTKTAYSKDVVGKNVESMVAAMKSGDFGLLENLRFEKHEKIKTDKETGEVVNQAEYNEHSKQLASPFDYYVNSAYGVSHRDDASLVGVTGHIPSVMGKLPEKELKVFGEVMNNPKRPVTVILGGKKVSEKIDVFENLIEQGIADTILIGGAMGYTFIKATGGQVGDSFIDGKAEGKEKECLEKCREILEKAKQKGVKIELPIDTVAGDKFPEGNEKVHRKSFDIKNIPSGWQGLDIGPETVKKYSGILKNGKAGTVVWNGPMGVFEHEDFKKGTEEIIKAVIASGAISIIGGGDTASAVVGMGYGEDVTFVSTGGGASLYVLEGKILPAMAALWENGVTIAPPSKRSKNLINPAEGKNKGDVNGK